MKNRANLTVVSPGSQIPPALSSKGGTINAAKDEHVPRCAGTPNRTSELNDALDYFRGWGCLDPSVLRKAVERGVSRSTVSKFLAARTVDGTLKRVRHGVYVFKNSQAAGKARKPQSAKYVSQVLDLMKKSGTTLQ